MNELLKKLEEESTSISLASGLSVAVRIARNLESYSQILEAITASPRDSIKLLERVEALATQLSCKDHVNPHDNFVFAMVLLLKDFSKNNSEYGSGKFHLAQQAAQKMANPFWAHQVRSDNFLEILYDTAGVSKSDALDEVYLYIPEMLDEEKFDLVNDILVRLDVTKLHNSIMYGILHLVSLYVDYLPHYNQLWQRVFDEFVRRREFPEAYKDQIRTDDQIHNLLDHLKVIPDNLKVDLEKKRNPPKSYEEIWQEKIQDKINWAQEIGDKELVNMLTFYRDYNKQQQNSGETYRQLRVRLGDKELERQTAEALRAMADKIEQSGSHFMIHCELPKLPIFSGDYSSSISVTIVAGPLGG